MIIVINSKHDNFTDACLWSQSINKMCQGKSQSTLDKHSSSRVTPNDPLIYATTSSHRWILIGYFKNYNFSKHNNALPDDGANAPKYVRAVLMLILM